jgi:hypothetical protein
MYFFGPLARLRDEDMLLVLTFDMRFLHLAL